jgi:hypothetical protein
MEQPLLGMHDAANLERARTNYRQERQTINQQGPEHTTVVVAAAELSHNAAGRAAGQPFSPVGLQQLEDLVHLSKPRLPAVVFGLLYKRLWTRLAVDLAQQQKRHH